MIAVALIVVLLGAELDGGTDAGLGWNDPLYSMCPAAPLPEQLDGGSWLLTPARASRNACLAETCQSRRLTLEHVAAAPPMLSSGSLVADLVIWALGLCAGIYLGFNLRGLFK